MIMAKVGAYYEDISNDGAFAHAAEALRFFYEDRCPESLKVAACSTFRALYRRPLTVAALLAEHGAEVIPYREAGWQAKIAIRLR